MSDTVMVPKKLIEVALPLDAINAAAAKEKSIRHGHPSTLHHWWARRPLAAARAVLFSQLVNDPSWKWELEHSGQIPPNNLKASWAASRKRLFSILEDLVKWENITDEEVLKKARAEIRKSWCETCELNKGHPQATELFNADKLPALHDPFAGGGAIPLEAQRLGLDAHASDLNPVAALITKAMIEIPPKFSDRAPVGPLHKNEHNERLDLVQSWPGVTGMAEDVRRYAAWVHQEAKKRIGHLYPPAEVTAEMAKHRPDLQQLVGKKLTVVAWLWARTVKSPNPAFHNVDVPLASTFMLSTKAGHEAYVEPVIGEGGYRFAVRVGKPKDAETAKNGTKLSRGSFRCLFSGVPISYQYIDDEANAGRMGSRLMAVVAEGARGRVYLPPTEAMEAAAREAKPTWKPDVPSRGTWASNAQGRRYGFQTFGDYFTPRQLLALTTFSDLVEEVRERVKRDALATGLPDNGGLAAGGTGATAYAEAVSVYLAFARDKVVNWLTTISHWWGAQDKIRPTFTRQAIPMTWDYSEANPFSGAAGDLFVAASGIADAISRLPSASSGVCVQRDAREPAPSMNVVFSTDPPYYNNIGYADLSDFFYVWLRRSLRSVFPDIFSTIATPKAQDLVACPYRHGSKEKAEAFFLDGMTQALHRLAEQAHPAFPATIYYAFKQSESESDTGTVSTGWETFLVALVAAGFALSGTWPMRTENAGRMVGQNTNALASSIILVCRPRAEKAPTVSRRAFLRELNQILPEALDEMTRGSGDERSPVAPVDLSQAIIGPGMAVFSKYAAVLEADGTPMPVKTALRLINRFLAEDDFDHDTQFCLHWFEQYGWKDGKFGDADTLARAKGTSVDGVKQAGVLLAAGGAVRLLKWSDYSSDWDPVSDKRLPVWEVLHQLIRVFKSEGETGAGRALATIQAKAEPTRQLAYRLYTLCERAGWSEDARAYNEIVTSWSAIESAAAAAPVLKQASLFG
jgi:putative DNA methylase